MTDTPLSPSLLLAPDWHPLSLIDQFILSCGWTHDGRGFIAPPDWQAGLALQRGGTGAEHYPRETACAFCVRFHESRNVFAWTGSVKSDS